MKIPWTGELKSIPEIAWAHHEKLDGSGYPRGLKAADIPVQSRMMTIADIYDALVAQDRPYKKAVPPERALDILRGDVRNGWLDGELLRVFIEAKIYDLPEFKALIQAQDVAWPRHPSSSPTGATRRTVRRTPSPPSPAPSRSGPSSSSSTCSSPRTAT